MAEFQPFKPLRLSFDPERLIDEAFIELIHEPWGSLPETRESQPAIDIFEDDDAYVIEADLPGVNPENIDVRVEGRELTICGTRQSVSWLRSERSVRVERARGEFCRTVELEHPVDPSRIEKRYVNGILQVRLPKKR